MIRVTLLDIPDQGSKIYVKKLLRLLNNAFVRLIDFVGISDFAVEGVRVKREDVQIRVPLSAAFETTAEVSRSSRCSGPSELCHNLRIEPGKIRADNDDI